MKTTECRTLYGKQKEVPTEQLTFRPGVYGLIVHENKLLTVMSRNAGLLMMPGGGIELGETMEAALKREIQEECGIEVEIEKFLFFTESFFYYDPFAHAYHAFLFYYRCNPISFDLHSDDAVDDEEVTSPQWRLISELKPSDFQNNGELVLKHLVP